ncbi:MAG TPA: ATP-binding protein [Candidatus Chromulinivoraceae bacterium]|nr:ATP-binding protein [Candidatus Chromulinivoraceae bacterium]
MLELIILSLSVLANFGLAFVVVAKNPGGRVNRLFGFLALSLVLWLSTNYISTHPIFFDQLTWIRLAIACAAIMSMAMLLLTNVFPQGNPYKKKLSIVTIVVGCIVAAAAVSPFVFTHLEISGSSVNPVPGPGMILFMPFIFGTLGGSIYILFRKFHILKGHMREQVRYAIIGVMTTFSLLAFLNFIVIILFHNTSYIFLSPLVGLVFTTSFAYGIVRHQLFDIRLIIARFIAYILLLLVAGTLYGFLGAGLSFFIIGVQPSIAQILVSTAVVGFLVLFVEPLRRFFNHITRAIFYQDDYDTKNILDALATVLVHSTETKPLATASLNILKKALKSDFITLILIDEAADDEKGRHISVGRSAPLLAEVTPQQLQQHVTDVVSMDTVQAPSNHFHREVQEAGISVIIRLETKSEVVGYCIFGYKTTGSAYSQRDIDLIRIAGDELAVAVQNTLRFEQIQVFNATLRKRIEDATKELRTSNEQLQRLDAAKDEFVSMASHQLRTPLTSVKGYISMVLEGDAGKITGVQRQLLGEAFTSSERMVHLINDFLNVSRLQTGKFVLESKPIDLAKVTMQEVDSLQTTANAHDLKLQYRAPSVFPILYIDESKIRQVIMNFIDNAIYYSHEHTVIHVELTIEEGDAVLRVKDTGIGVPKTEQAHLFSKFFRATNARKQRPDGTGVGLFLAKKVVVAHGGTIVFESVEDVGSTFGFRLPIKKLSAPTDNAD